MPEDLYLVAITPNKMFGQSQIALFQTLFKDMNVCNINFLFINYFFNL